MQAQQPDLALHQVADQLDQVLERAAHAVELPDHQHVAGAQMPQQFIECRARGFRAAGDILVDAFAAGRFKGIYLQGRILVARSRSSLQYSALLDEFR